MKALPLLLSAAVLGVASLHAQTSLTMKPNYNCGRVSQPLYCYGIPLQMSGTTVGSEWIDVNTKTGVGFVQYTLDGEAFTGTITSITTTLGSVTSNGQKASNVVTSITINFTDDLTGAFGTTSANFSYYYSSGGGGRGGAGAGWRFNETSGSFNLTNVQTSTVAPNSPIAPTPVDF